MQDSQVYISLFTSPMCVCIADGLGSTQDPAFHQSFADLYTAPSLQVPWYNVLGNHDYGDGAPQEDALPSHCAPTDQGCYFSPVHQVSCLADEHDSVHI